MAQYQLTVDLTDLQEGLKRLPRRGKVRPYEKAVLGFDGRFFSIEALSTVSVMKATGIWPGVATISAATIMALAKVPPTANPFKVSYEEGRVRIGTMSVGADWTPVSLAAMDTSGVPDWVGWLSLKYRAQRGTILANGADSQIKAADHKLDLLVAQVAKRLAPLGVDKTALRRLVEVSLARKYGAPHSDGK